MKKIKNILQNVVIIMNSENIFKKHDIVDKLFEIANESNYIDPNFYNQYNVKRGLRNSNGTGVLVGLTNIGDVHGYIFDENEKVEVEGRLRYRGIDVTEMVRTCIEENRFGFEETIFLITFGKLPTKSQLTSFTELLNESMKLPPNFTEDIILKNPSPDIMNKLAKCVLGLYSHDKNPDDLSLPNLIRQSILLIARFPVMIAHAYCAKSHYTDGKSLYLHSPQKGLTLAENFLYMIRPDNKYTDLEAKVLDLALILHAEHGAGNNSTFVTKVVSSTGTDTYSAIAASVGSLKGPKHGGANNRVIGMMEEIKSNVKNWNNDDELKAYITKILNKEAYDRSGLVYGMGHAVYTLSDPRAVLLKEYAEKLAKAKNCEKEFELYKSIERLTPQLFHEIKGHNQALAANVDFYSGFVYNMLGIQSELYTPLFAMARIVGWCAHRIEEVMTNNKIIRPAYKSVAKKGQYIPIDKR